MFSPTAKAALVIFGISMIAFGLFKLMDVRARDGQMNRTRAQVESLQAQIEQLRASESSHTK